MYQSLSNTSQAQCKATVLTESWLITTQTKQNTVVFIQRLNCPARHGIGHWINTHRFCRETPELFKLQTKQMECLVMITIFYLVYTHIQLQPSNSGEKENLEIKKKIYILYYWLVLYDEYIFIFIQPGIILGSFI